LGCGAYFDGCRDMNQILRALDLMLGIGGNRSRSFSDDNARSEAVSRLWSQWQNESPEHRAEHLLREWLTPGQADQYGAFRSFEVVGCDTGKRYRIYRARVMNIAELDAVGEVARQWCVVPEGALPVEDIMLAQKIALEGREADTLAIARTPQDSGALSSIFCQCGALLLMAAAFATLIWLYAPS
jgi:hypothetical protein